MQQVLIIAGAGQTARELARRMVRSWTVKIVDPSAEALQHVRSDAELEAVTCIQGDATSSLVLNQAGMESATAAVALAAHDEVNLEFCRLARQLYGVERVLVLVRRRSQVSVFESLGVTVVNRPLSLASALQSQLEQARRTTADVGLGRGEILEVTVLPGSPVIGKTLAEINPQSWLVGAIYRNGTLVVPHGQTSVQEGDRVLLIGDPSILQSIADYFRAGEPEFPLQFGGRVLFYDPKGRSTPREREEAAWLAEHSRALGLLSDRSDLGQHVPGPGEQSLSTWTQTVDAGCLVTPGSLPNWQDLLGIRKPDYLRTLESAHCPVLISRGSFPYRRLLVAVGSGRPSLRAVEVALDLARVLGVEEITAALALPPELVAGPNVAAELEKTLDKAVALGKLLRFSVKPVRLAGNPVHQVLNLAREFDLLVLAHRRARRFSLSRPDVSSHLIARASISTLVRCHD